MKSPQILSEQPEYSIELINFGITSKKRFFGDHFYENAASGPYIDWGGVLDGAKKDFRGSVPQCYYFMRIRAYRHRKNPGQPKIADLNIISSQFLFSRNWFYQKILWLQIPV
jgi:hypothetical protein